MTTEWQPGEMREVLLVPHAERSLMESAGYQVHEHDRGHHSVYGVIAYRTLKRDETA